MLTVSIMRAHIAEQAAPRDSVLVVSDVDTGIGVSADYTLHSVHSRV